ncbi:M3 family metallopeptidase [Spirochaeta dissipatitropha]
MNPLTDKWDQNYGLPPFDRIQPEHFATALEQAMSEHQQEIEAIAGNPDEPDFDNTMAAFDRSGWNLDRILGVFYNLCSSETSKELQAAERDLSPKIAAHENRVSLHEGLFKRIDKLYEQRKTLNLNPEQDRLLERVHMDFVRNGAKLSGENRKRFAEINEELASLYTDFSQAVLGDAAAFALALTTEEDRAGLPDFVLDAAQAAAREKGMEGYVINLSPSLVDPFMTYSPRRDLREKVWKAFRARGESCPERDTRPGAAKIVKLRAEQAALLGYRSFAEHALQDRMAKTPAAAQELLERVWEPAKKRAAEELAELQAIALRLDGPEQLEAWDWDYYAEKLRQEKFNLDESVLKPYFQLDNMINAMFDCASRLYGISFHEKHGIPMYHPDVRVFEVHDNTGKLTGVFLSDNFARSSKRSGAWMSEFRDQSKNREQFQYPIIINNNNFAKASDGNPCLLSFDDVRTLFHEFGHGLHGLLSNVTYSRLAGTNVLRDFVELPSQINENWALEPEVLKKFAVHAKSGQVISDELIELIRSTREFNQGFMTVSYTSSALVDMALHSMSDPKELDQLDISVFERDTCSKLGVPAIVGMRHRLPHFLHLFADGGYAAGYYVYMWAEVLEADAYEAFEESGKVFNQDLSASFLKNILSAGDTIDPALAFRNFRGRDPEPVPMMKKRGLV